MEDTVNIKFLVSMKNKNKETKPKPKIKPKPKLFFYRWTYDGKKFI